MTCYSIETRVDATSDLIGNKIINKITKNLPQNNSETEISLCMYTYMCVSLLFVYVFIMVTDNCNLNRVLNLWSKYNRNIEKL